MSLPAGCRAGPFLCVAVHTKVAVAVTPVHCEPKVSTPCMRQVTVVTGGSKGIGEGCVRVRALLARPPMSTSPRRAPRAARPF